MHFNLISTANFDDGLVNDFGGIIWKLTKESLIIARGKKERPCSLCNVEVNVAYNN